MSNIRKLPPLQREILKRVVVLQPKRPEPFKFGQLYKVMDYKKYTEELAASGLRSLVEGGYFVEKGDETYQFSRNHYFEARKNFRFSAFFSDANSSTAISVLMMAAAAAGLFTVAFLRVFDSNNSYPEHLSELVGKPAPLFVEVARLENRLLSHEARIDEILNISDEQKIAAALKELREDLEKLDESMSVIRDAIAEDPAKLVELSLVRSQLQSLRERQDERYTSLSREIDKMATYNTTIIGFMITFLVALLGFGIFNYVREGSRARRE